MRERWWMRGGVVDACGWHEGLRWSGVGAGELG